MSLLEMTSLIASILLPIGALIKWVSIRFDKKFEQIDKQFSRIDEHFEKIREEMDELKQDIVEVRRDIRYIDCRMSLMEGRYEERGVWESRSTGTNDKEYR